MLVKLDLDPKIVWRLEEQAESEGMTIGEFVGQAVTYGIKAPRKWHTNQFQGEITRQEIARLHAEGLTDAEIAQRVDRVREYVADVRRKLGLKANRRRQA